MKYTLIGELPRHIYCYVDTKHTHVRERGFAKAVWFGLVSYPGRVWGCNVMLESGAIYRNVPSHGIAFSEYAQERWYPAEAQTWDCYGTGFTTLEYNYLSGLECKVMLQNPPKEMTGHYLFTAAPVGDAFSAAPDQAKEFTFVKLENDRLTIQPTNQIVFWEQSFTDGKFEFPKGLARQTKIYSVE